MKIRKLLLDKYSHLLTTLCVGVFVISIILYVYFLSLSVMHVVMRKEALQDLNELRSKIANLEASYIESRHLISGKLSSLEGLEENNSKIFIKQTESSLVLRSSVE